VRPPQKQVIAFFSSSTKMLAMNQRSNSATSALRPIMDSVGNCRTSVRCQKRHWVNQWDFGAAVGTMSLSWGVFSTPNGGDQSSKLKSKTDCVGGSLRISHTSKFLTKFARQRAPRQPNEFWGWGSEKSVPKIFGALAVDARGSARRQAHRAHVLSLPSPRRFPALVRRDAVRLVLQLDRVHCL
jgi:hypothetical protein